VSHIAIRCNSGFGFEYNDEQIALRDLAKKFSREEIIPKAAHYDKTGEFPWDIVKKAHSLGLMNLSVPTNYGGGGLKLLDSCIIGIIISIQSNYFVI
jgi:acyl-CoA dehydrogenase